MPPSCYGFGSNADRYNGHVCDLGTFTEFIASFTKGLDMIGFIHDAITYWDLRYMSDNEDQFAHVVIGIFHYKLGGLLQSIHRSSRVSLFLELDLHFRGQKNLGKCR